MPVNSLTRRRIDFTSKDFDSWLTDLRTLAQSVFPQWTDFNKANIGNLLLELYAHTLDLATHTIDQYANERIVVCARLRKSMIDLGKLVGFTLPGSTEASADLEFTIADGNVRAVDVVIPAGTRCQAPDIQNPITFWTTVEARIVAGSLQVSNVAARAAEPVQDTFSTDGTPNQIIKLAKSPYLDGSAVVVIAGDSYVYTDNMLLCGPTDKVFTIVVDEHDYATLLFGDNVNGYAPNGAGTCDYEVGGGVAGNVDANAITSLMDPARDENGNIVSLVVRNPSEAGGGTDRMSVEEARVAIPQSVITANQVTCTRDQFEINPRNVRGVARTLVLTHDEEPTIPEYQADVHIVPTGGGLPSAALKAEVLNEITVVRPQPVGMDVFVLDPDLKIISVTATVYLAEGFTEAEVRANIETALDAFFALVDENGNPNTQIDFGYHIKKNDGTPAAEVPWSDIFNAVRDAEGVRKLDKSTFVPNSDTSLDLAEFPVLGSISLINGDTSNPF